jgi:hypothetical protein
MKLYAETGALRSRQVIGDLALVVWVVLWVRLGLRVHEMVLRLGGPGEAVERAGEQLAGTGASGGARVEDLPLIGGALRRPFDAIASGGESLVRAGELQQDAAASLALVVALVLAGLPILWLAGRYLPWRTGVVREATAAARLRDAGAGPELFALRALSNRSLAQLASVSADPWADYRAGRHDRLAALELDAVGIQTDAPPPAAEAGDVT